MKEKVQLNRKKSLIGNSDLGIPYTTPWNRAVVNAVKSLLGLNKLNELYDAGGERQGVEFAMKALRKLDARADISLLSVQNIPSEGAFVLISNQPHGALDGLLLIDAILAKRTDTKFFGNFVLSHIEPLRDLFIELNSDRSGVGFKNIVGIRAAMEHVREGHPLIIFPAGAVSTYQGMFTRLEDREWGESGMKLIRSLNVPVIPMYISGRNSRKYHLAAKVHPLLGTMRLPLELLNKQGVSIPIEIGGALSPQQLSGLETIKSYSDYLRVNVYALRARVLGSGPESTAREIEPTATVAYGHVPSSELWQELEKLDSGSKLYSEERFDVFFAQSRDMPLITRELSNIGKAELVAQGTQADSETALSRLDVSHGHLFVWDRQNGCIAGTYRVGLGDQLLKEYGAEGFFAYGLFEFSPKFNRLLKRTVELGHPYVPEEYGKGSKIYTLLWKGIAQLMTSNRRYRYVIGPVTVPADYATAAKWMIAGYMAGLHREKDMVRLVVPRNGVSALGRVRMPRDILSGVFGLELLDKLVKDIDPKYEAVPDVLKYYMRSGGKVLATNVDVKHGGSLDILMFTDIKTFPRNLLEPASED